MSDDTILTRYGEKNGCAVFGSDKSHNDVFKSLGGIGNRNLTNPQTGKKQFGWVFTGKAHPLLKEFFEHCDMERFFTDHPEITRYKRVYEPRDSNHEQPQAVGGGKTVSVADVVRQTAAFFNQDKMYPGPVIGYIIGNIAAGRPRQRRNLIAKNTTIRDGTHYLIYEGPADDVEAVVEAAEIKAQRTGTSIKVIRVDENLVAIRSRGAPPVVAKAAAEAEDDDETEAEPADEEEIPTKKVKKVKKVKKIDLSDD